jgi:hypothetical protein
MNTLTFLILKEDISCLTLLTAIYRDLTDQISLMNIRVRVTCSNIVLSPISKLIRLRELIIDQLVGFPVVEPLHPGSSP